MNCEEARLQIGAEPNALSAPLQQHLSGCADCTGYRAETLRIETGIARAMQLPLPRGHAPGIARESAGDSAKVVPLPRRASPWRNRGWALAASVLMAVAIGVMFGGGRDGEALATELVSHMGGELASWDEKRPIPQSALDLVLKRSGVRLDRAALGEVVYAHACFFRGRYVPHLVVNTSSGPVTVMVLQGESVRGTEHFDEGGYSGVLASAPGGSVAVLGRGATEVEEPLRRVLAALEPAAN